LKLIIIGGGSDLERLKALVKELKCEPQVRFYGYLPFAGLLTMLESADVGLNAMYRSPYSELIDTNKMYEYIALRIPVITSRLPAIEDNFDNRALMFFEPGDYLDLAECILRLHDAPNLRHELARNAHARYEVMRWNKTKHRYTRLVMAPAVACRQRI
jgi:glycosyltransferase involved in cell wall biosynthesis